MSHDALIEKLQKMMALKDRAQTEGEAAAAAERISILLHKHNIDIGVLDRKEKQKGAEGAPIKVSTKIQPYDVSLANAAMLMTDTKYFIRWMGYNRDGKFHKKYAQIVFVGLTDNVDAAIAMYSYLRESVEYMLNERWKKGQIAGKPGCRSYRIGASAAILQKCNDIVEARAAMKNVDQQCTALVLVSNAVAESYLNDVVKPEGKINVNFQPSDDWSYYRGVKDGRSVDPENNKSLEAKGEEQS